MFFLPALFLSSGWTGGEASLSIRSPEREAFRTWVLIFDTGTAMTGYSFVPGQRDDGKLSENQPLLSEIIDNREKVGDPGIFGPLKCDIYYSLWTVMSLDA